MKRLKKTHWAVACAIALVLVGGMLALHYSPAQEHPSAPAAPKVTVAQVIVRPIQPTHEFSGHVEAVNTVKIRPRADGYIESVHFKPGERVKKGQLLFQIDSRPYRAEVARLDAQLQAAQAKYTLAKSNAERARKLIHTGAISRKQAESLASAAKSGRAQVASTKASLAAARLKLGFTQVRSPIAGRIGKARITPGNLVTSADILTTVVTVSPVYVDFNVDEHTYLQLLQSGFLATDDATVPIAMGLADDKDYPYHGRVGFVANSLHSNTGTIELRATFSNQKGLLTPGVYARVRLPTGSPRPRVLIGPRAVGTDLSSKYVYVVGKNEKVEHRKVTLGPLYHGLRIVRTGLERGDVIVVNGLQHVRPGVKVDPNKVAMERRLSKSQRALVNAAGDSRRKVQVVKGNAP